SATTSHISAFIDAILNNPAKRQQLGLPENAGPLTLYTNDDVKLKLGDPLGKVLLNKKGEVTVNDEDHPLIVKLAEPAPAPTVKRPRLVEPDPTKSLLHELLEPFPKAPSSLEVLKQYLVGPLPRALPIIEPIIEDERVELSHGRLALHVTAAIDMCGMAGTSEDMRHLGIDLLIRTMVEDARDYGMIPEVEFDRNTTGGSGVTKGFDFMEHILSDSFLTDLPLIFSSTAATAKSLRPDWMVWLKGNLLFKGEEKAEQREFGDAIKELTSKFGVMPRMFYSNVSFMICYAAAGPLLAFYAIERETRALHDISPVYRLTIPSDRLSILCVVFNILRLLWTWYPRLERPRFSLGEALTHNDSTIVFLEDSVLKTVAPANLFRHNGESVTERVEFLRSMYAFAQNKPGLVQGKVTYRNRGSYQVRMSTIGIPLSKHKRSMTEADVRNAAKAVLQGLDCLHSASIVHRDIRLENVLYLPAKFRGHSYALIDLEHA
ncbi:hypothetical protein HK102_005283, partial [Quaeritorhiza haematococci]